MARDPSEKLLGIDIDDRNDRPDDAGDTDEEVELEQFVLFWLGDHRLAVPVESVRTLAEIPDEMTRVPRAPPAIEGMIDLRGEIIAVVDPHVHFPSIEPAERSDRDRLLVLDRPSDQQSAAIRVDGVVGVESVPTSDVIDETAIEDRPLEGDALDHPLVEALIERERTPATGVGSTVASSPADDATGSGIASGGTAALSATTGDRVGPDDAGTPFSLGADDDTPDEPDDASPSTRDVVVEGIPLVDVETLLLASGRPSDSL